MSNLSMKTGLDVMMNEPITREQIDAMKMRRRIYEYILGKAMLHPKKQEIRIPYEAVSTTEFSWREIFKSAREQVEKREAEVERLQAKNANLREGLEMMAKMMANQHCC